MALRARLALLAAAAVALVGVLAVGLLARAGGSADGGADGFAGAVRPAIPAEDFVLHDQDGKRVDVRDLRGRPVVVTFLYTTCRDTCPVTAQTIGAALDRLGRPVPTIAVSVDPANDTPERARRFLVARHVAGRMRFLLGTRAELAPVWRDFGIRPQGKGLEHSAYVVLLDRRGRQRVGFPVDRLTPEGLAHDLRRLAAGRA